MGSSYTNEPNLSPVIPEPRIKSGGAAGEAFRGPVKRVVPQIAEVPGRSRITSAPT